MDCTEIEVFSEATVRTIIIQFQKQKNSHYLKYKRTNDIIEFSDFDKKETHKIERKIVEANNQNWALIFKLDQKITKLITKIKENSTKLKENFPEISQGLIAYDKYKGQSKEIIKNRAFHSFQKIKENHRRWLYGGDVTRYAVQWNGKEYIEYCDEIANPRNPKYFRGKRILIREITNPSIFATITNKELYNDPSILIIKESNSFSLEYLLGILNSKLATFFHFNSSPKATKGAFPKILVYDIKNFPLPTEDENVNIEKLVKKVLAKKSQNPQADTSALEAEIDRKVYELYGLSAEEIAIVEGETELA